jgi:phosphoglycolate phosphatase
MKLVLFDVDLTLIRTGGAGIRALNAAVAALHGTENAFEGIEFAGRTDRAIIEDGLSRARLDSSEESLFRVRAAYLTRLSIELASPACTVSALPGSKEVLTRLSGDPGFLCGLVTGNWKEGAFLKLAACGLDGFFRFGAFAEDGRDRSLLVKAAMGKATCLARRRFELQDIWVAGDTPHDIACGRAWGTRTLGVATGPFDSERLHSAGATAVVKDLADTAAVIRILEGQG